MAETGDVILRFQNVTFEYIEDRPLLEDASFGVREGAKVTVIGQNGAGKSTIFKMITGELKPKTGTVTIRPGAKIAIAEQVMPEYKMEKTVTEYFEEAFAEKKYDIDKRITEILDVVNLDVAHDKVVRDLSGGQKARLLLAFALIQNPDILLLDEPTNNLDAEGIFHLTYFLQAYEKTVIVISHDTEFLNSFTTGVLNLDIYTQKVNQYAGDYYDVVANIAAQIERDRMKNARLQKEIIDRKEKVNFFANKGGKMRKLASKLRDEIEEAEDNKVDTLREDKTLRGFEIEPQDVKGDIVVITKVSALKNHKPVERPVDIKLRRGQKLIIEGPNGIGKSTFLRALAKGEAPGAEITPGVKVGYYQQDFSGLDYDQTGYQALASSMESPDNETIFAVGAHFLLKSSTLGQPIRTYSEGQKGLLCYAQFVLQEPALLILDEPTNHINFRHLPVIAEAINDFTGTVIMVSHVADFVEKIKFTDTLDLSK
ncbi:MAG: ABC-F family ATP-binding cassette domain-containing protein [Candidatus Magasanikbacteria bacterium]|nr:ABC-F family ATP-binding cassette domain-containing protein [Candidatus Magasanikbacteria bacterium]